MLYGFYLSVAMLSCFPSMLLQFLHLYLTGSCLIFKPFKLVCISFSLFKKGILQPVWRTWTGKLEVESLCNTLKVDLFIILLKAENMFLKHFAHLYSLLVLLPLNVFFFFSCLMILFSGLLHNFFRMIKFLNFKVNDATATFQRKFHRCKKALSQRKHYKVKEESLSCSM